MTVATPARHTDLHDIANQIGEVERILARAEKAYPEAERLGKMSGPECEERLSRLRGARDSLVRYSNLRLKHPEDDKP